MEAMLELMGKRVSDSLANSSSGPLRSQSVDRGRCLLGAVRALNDMVRTRKDLKLNDGPPNTGVRPAVRSSSH